jgi:UDPglucose 6-dehydrogenase
VKIAVIGTGYVGLVQGVMLAEFGMNVTCMDVDNQKIELLCQGNSPIYEPGLQELLQKNINSGSLKFTTDIKMTVEEANVIFIAVGTPPEADGSADLKYVLSVANSIGEYINEYKVVVNKSTVPVGTGVLVRDTISAKLAQRSKQIDFDIVSNPEFLREGRAVQDCLNPDRIVLGTTSTKAMAIMTKIYHALQVKQVPFVLTNIETAEMIKYASNAFLAVKISYINEISALAEKVGANTIDIARAMGLDSRIAPEFLQAGPGYGGSCFPKDTQAIVDIAKKNDSRLLIIESAIAANIRQKQRLVEKIIQVMGCVENKKIAVLGLSFKPDTDDMRDAPSLYIIPELINQGVKIQAYCPAGMKEAKWRLDKYTDKIVYCKNEYEAATNCDAMIILTEWAQFSYLDLKKIKTNMIGNYLFDYRNMFFDDSSVRSIFKYVAVGVV